MPQKYEAQTHKRTNEGLFFQPYLRFAVLQGLIATFVT
jgi:hypothetical protein